MSSAGTDAPGANRISGQDGDGVAETMFLKDLMSPFGMTLWPASSTSLTPTASSPPYRDGVTCCAAVLRLGVGLSRSLSSSTARFT